MPVHKLLPSGVADLLLSLLVLGAGSGDDLVDLGVPVHIVEEIHIGNCLSVHYTHVIFAGHGMQSGLKGGRVYNEREKGQCDDDGYRKPELNANFLKNRHFSL